MKNLLDQAGVALSLLFCLGATTPVLAAPEYPKASSNAENAYIRHVAKGFGFDLGLGEIERVRYMPESRLLLRTGYKMCGALSDAVREFGFDYVKYEWPKAVQALLPEERIIAASSVYLCPEFFL